MTFADKGFKVRFAGPQDAENFSRWAANNRFVDPGDIRDSLKASNPTSTVLVVEKNGIPILFAPFYATIVLAYLGFNPETDNAKDRVTALEIMKKAMMLFAELHGVREILTYTSADQQVAQWAEKHEFRPESRTAYRLKFSKKAA